jgi:hypothetical protein
VQPCIFGFILGHVGAATREVARRAALTMNMYFCGMWLSGLCVHSPSVALCYQLADLRDRHRRLGRCVPILQLPVLNSIRHRLPKSSSVCLFETTGSRDEVTLTSCHLNGTSAEPMGVGVESVDSTYTSVAIVP